jgi:hypothetical protein
MSQATAIPNTVTVSFAHFIDGVHWFQTDVTSLDFDKFKALPSVVKYHDKTYRKVGWNSDNGTVSYRESDAFAVAIGK